MKGAGQNQGKRVLIKVLSNYFFTTTNPLKTKGFTPHRSLTTPPHPIREGGQGSVWCVVWVWW